MNESQIHTKLLNVLIINRIIITNFDNAHHFNVIQPHSNPNLCLRSPKQGKYSLQAQQHNKAYKSDSGSRVKRVTASFVAHVESSYCNFGRLEAPRRRNLAPFQKEGQHKLGNHHQHIHHKFILGNRSRYLAVTRMGSIRFPT